MRAAVGTVGGAVVGFAAWVLMIIVTSGVCSLPVLEILWCSPALPGTSMSSELALWDFVLLVVFVMGGAVVGREQIGELRRASRSARDDFVETQDEQNEDNSLLAANEDIDEEPLSPRAGHWPERNQSGFPQVTLEAWLWWPETDEWENATLTATVTPATSADQFEEFHLAIEKGDGAELIKPDTVWMHERTDLESDYPVYELRVLSSDGNSGEALYRCLVSSESPWLGDLCRYLGGYWEIRGRNPRGPQEFDAMPVLKADWPEEVSSLVEEQATTVDEPARPHDQRWCSVRKANVLPAPDGVCPACGTKIGT